jgi:hypothetical protein
MGCSQVYYTARGVRKTGSAAYKASKKEQNGKATDAGAAHEASQSGVWRYKKHKRRRQGQR